MKDFRKIYIAAENKIKASEGFKQRTTEKLFKEKYTTFSLKRSAVIFAVIMILAVLCAGTVYAVNRLQKVRLSDSVQFSSATDIYTEEVDRSIEYDGLKITLSEALYENGKLYVTFNFQSKKYADAYFLPAELEPLMIDGMKIPCSVFGSCQDYSGTILYTLEYDLTGVELKNSHNFTVGFNTAEVMTEVGNIKIINGDWDYSFSLNVNALDSETEVYYIGKELTLNNGDVIMLEKIICTPLSQRIYYTLNGYNSCRLYAEGKDCEFVFSEIMNKKGEAVNIYPDNFNFNIKELTLTVTVLDKYENVLADSVEIVCTKQD